MTVAVRPPSMRAIRATSGCGQRTESPTYAFAVPFPVLAVALVYRPAPPGPEELGPLPPQSPVELQEPGILEWNPARGDLARIAAGIEDLRRSSPASLRSLSGRDRSLREVRERMERLKQ